MGSTAGSAVGSAAGSAVGSAVGVASDTWRLARDARPETPPERRLTDVQRAELEERVKRRTMDLAWAMTARDIEATARAVVDAVARFARLYRLDAEGLIGPAEYVRVQLAGTALATKSKIETIQLKLRPESIHALHVLNICCLQPIIIKFAANLHVLDATCLPVGYRGPWRAFPIRR